MSGEKITKSSAEGPKNYFEGKEWQLPTDIRIVNSAVAELRKRLQEATWKGEVINDLEVAFREMLVNAIVHGNLGVKTKSEEESWQDVALREQARGKIDRSIHIKLDIASDKAVVVIRDEGEGFDWKKQTNTESEEGDILKTSGRGMRYFVATLVDSINYNEKGNEVTLTKNIDRIEGLFAELGIDVKNINPNILRKLKLLNERTEIFKDEERSMHVARALFKHYEENMPDKTFTGQEQRIVLIGTMFTDIGKTGPRDATPEQEELILDIYGVENIIDPKKVILSQFINDNFSDDADERLKTLEEMGISSGITMREFYNLHAKWTLETISGDGVPPEAVAAAATHHMLEGINPEEIVGKDGRFTRYFGDNVSFDRAEKLIIILDKYDAFRRRGKKEHKEAIELVRKVIKANPNFAEDKEFEDLLDNLDAMLSVNEEVYEE